MKGLLKGLILNQKTPSECFPGWVTSFYIYQSVCKSPRESKSLSLRHLTSSFFQKMCFCFVRFPVLGIFVCILLLQMFFVDMMEGWWRLPLQKLTAKGSAIYCCVPVFEDLALNLVFSRDYTFLWLISY